MIRSYAELLRLPGASAAALPGALARLAGTMVPLALLLAMVQSGHSLAAGGSAGAAYALGSAVGSPVNGRLMDRRGPAPVLRITGPVTGLLLAGFALGTAWAPTGALLAAAGAAGLTTAPVGASARALWNSLTEDADLRKRAYAFEATLSELLFILGPSAVSALGWLTGARDALLATAVLLGAGALGFGQAEVVRRQRPKPPSAQGASPASARRGTAALSVLTAIGLTAALSTALAVAVTAALRAQGTATELAGSLVALQSAGSVLGGLLYGARSRAGSTFGRYARLLVVLTAALATLPAFPLAHRAGLPPSWALFLLGVLLVCSGLPMAPTGAEEFQLIGEMTPQHRMTEAFAGVGSFISIGGAAGSALTGVIAEGPGPAWALSLPAAFTAAALVLTLAARGPIISAVAGARAADHPSSVTTPNAGEPQA
ncbi:MFS transporter [Streptomyces sp. SP2-10]|uniref:MFS transporter n=1 Tax=Streptomyces sp. SP2-10 TaxID=2873385 RepID=UPI001CA65D22|nr:MFS transporter [Streptomyces sp. SP2-10]MBY8846167.1 MFS transporter [Streptomyces sp. SP2-10]